MRQNRVAVDFGEIRYAASGPHDLAYRAFGRGPLNLLYVPVATGGSIELLGSSAISMADVFDAHYASLARFARVIAYDRRGLGLSSRPMAVGLEEQAEDIGAVLDHAGAHTAAIFAFGWGAMPAIVFAASRPERVSHLLLFMSQARNVAAEGYEWPWDAETRQQLFVEPQVAHWGRADLPGLAHAFAPELAAEYPALDRDLALWQRISCPPSTARRFLEDTTDSDVREILPQIQAPTLVLNRPAAKQMDHRHSQYLAEHIPNAELCELPGQDTMPWGLHWQELADAVEEFVTGERSVPAIDPSRILSTVLFTDIVGSTTRAAELGDSRWRELLASHDAVSRSLIKEHGGRPVKSTGDGYLAIFDGPARAIRCAMALAGGIRELGLELRAGVHTGEVELIADDVAGLAVHIGSRIASLADGGEVLASSTVRDLVVGSGISFTERGVHELKGIPNHWPLCAVESVSTG